MSKKNSAATTTAPQNNHCKDSGLFSHEQGHIEGIAEELNKCSAEAECDPYKITDPWTQDPEPHYLLLVNGTGMMPSGDIQAIKAKSKQGKTHLCCILIAAMLGNTEFPVKVAESGLKVLYFDTEQHQRNTRKAVRRVYTMLGIEPPNVCPNFVAYSLRTKDTAERLPYIMEEVKKEKPDTVFIDGIVDLCSDFNNIQESQAVISSLMQLSAENDCAVCCVLHTNKGKEDNNMRGHLGTELEHKASDVLSVERKNGTFHVTQTDTRNKPVEGFTFVLDYDGIPHDATSFATEEKTSKLKTELQKAFGTSAALTFSELRDRLMDVSAVGRTTAGTRIAEAKTFGILILTNNQYKLA